MVKRQTADVFRGRRRIEVGKLGGAPLFCLEGYMASNGVCFVGSQELHRMYNFTKRQTADVFRGRRRIEVGKLGGAPLFCLEGYMASNGVCFVGSQELHRMYNFTK